MFSSVTIASKVEFGHCMILADKPQMILEIAHKGISYRLIKIENISTRTSGGAESGGEKLTKTWEELFWKQSTKLWSHPNTKPGPTVRRETQHSLHIGLALKTRPQSAKSVHIIILRKVRIWAIGIDIKDSWWTKYQQQQEQEQTATSVSVQQAVSEHAGGNWSVKKMKKTY
jgi:hypothetical protein